MVTEKLLFYNFKTMVDRVPDCDTKELQQFKKNAEKRTRRKALRPGLLFGQHGLKKKDTVQIL